jgi:hypothetical protein
MVVPTKIRYVHSVSKNRHLIVQSTTKIIHKESLGVLSVRYKYNALVSETLLCLNQSRKSCR